MGKTEKEKKGKLYYKSYDRENCSIVKIVEKT